MEIKKINHISIVLLKKLNNKKAKIGIFGLGYVGLPLCLTYSEKGYEVIGFDIDEKKLSILRQKKSYINHIENERINDVFKSKKLEVTSCFERVKELDALIICVPTPLTKNRTPDLSYIESTINNILPYVKKGQIMSLESTSYPGTTEEIIKPKIEEANFNIGEDFFLIYSPEREDPGNPNFNTSNIPKVMGGVSENCKILGTALYEQVICKVVTLSSPKAAEMTKLLENIHRAVNIGLINEMKILCDKMGVDLYEVIEAASTKPFGFTPYYPGPGLGGHCIPIDPFYLTWKAKEFELRTRFIELAGEINSSMPNYVVQKISDTLNDSKKSLRESKVLILGITYKKNVDDMRHSPSVEIIKLLLEKGAKVSFSDPHYQSFPEMRNHSFNFKSLELDPKTVSEFDVCVLCSDHDLFDYEMILENCCKLIDTRGRFKPSNKVFRA